VLGFVQPVKVLGQKQNKVNQVVWLVLCSTSLFSSKRIIECHLTTGKIGQKGSKALSEIAANVADDILFIVSTGKLVGSLQYRYCHSDKPS
jgi:DNA polymerase III delta subunit